MKFSFLLRNSFLCIIAFVFFSCSSTTSQYKGTGQWGSYHGAAATHNAAAENQPVQEADNVNQEQVLASANNTYTEHAPAYTALGKNSDYRSGTGAYNYAISDPELTPAAGNAAVEISTTTASGKHTNKVQKVSQMRVHHKLAVIGVVCAALAIVPFVSGLSLLFALPLALAGLITSWLGLKAIENNREQYTGSALAKAGFMISSIILIGFVLVLGYSLVL